MIFYRQKNNNIKNGFIFKILLYRQQQGRRFLSITMAHFQRNQHSNSDRNAQPGMADKITTITFDMFVVYDFSPAIMSRKFKIYLFRCFWFQVKKKKKLVSVNEMYQTRSVQCIVFFHTCGNLPIDCRIIRMCSEYFLISVFRFFFYFCCLN